MQSWPERDYSEYRTYYEEGFFQCNRCGLQARRMHRIILRTLPDGYQQTATATCFSCLGTDRAKSPGDGNGCRGGSDDTGSL